jgi:hypothetical protein
LEIAIGPFEKKLINNTKAPLINEIHDLVPDLTLKNLLVIHKQGITKLWLTLELDCYSMDKQFLLNVQKLLRAVRCHADLNWWFNADCLAKI